MAYTVARQAGLASKIQGLREAKAAFQALPAIVRDAMLVATETTASELARNAKVNILRSPSVQTRTLYNSVVYAVTRTNGRARVGITAGSTRIGAVRVKGTVIAGTGGSTLKSQGARRMNPAKYAKFIEFGSRTQPAEPFMIPAAQGQQGPYLDRCRAAGRVIEQNAAAIGGRNL